MESATVEEEAEAPWGAVESTTVEEAEAAWGAGEAVVEVAGGVLTVGSDATSWVTPAVSPTALFMTLRKTQVELASSLWLQVRQVNFSLRTFESRSSLG